jgi:hypothetical protein
MTTGDAATIRPVRHNSGTVVVLAGSAPAEVLAAVDRSMNVTLIRPSDSGAAGSAQPEEPDRVAGSDGLAVAADALRRAGRVASPYALVSADPLAALAAGWQAMWDVSRQQGAAEFEREAVGILAAWRANAFELPDYYLVLATPPDPAGDTADTPPDFYLGPLRSVRPNRVAFVTAAEPAQQAVGVLQALGSLKHGPWWPPLPDMIDTARGFFPGSLTESVLN